jgi:tetratricopeptide (TPR) repeat protein
MLPDDVVFRADQETLITFVPPENEKRSWLDVLRGALLIISRRPAAVEILTPFANAGIEGTEFLVVVNDQQATITVFEGSVAVGNASGQVVVGSGAQASARANQAPVAQAVARPRDAVQWTLYYAPVSAKALPEADEPPAQRASDPLFFAGRAARRLAVGRVDEARADLAQALTLDRENVEALSLQAIVALTLNERDEALRLAERAVAQNPESATALIALSYVRQAFFDISGALAALRDAVQRDPQDALAWARLSELWLAVGDVDEGLAAAQRAVALSPNLARTQTVLGFAYLTQVRLDEAAAAFHRAIELDQGAPLPRFGLGLASIRGGRLAEGREHIETAVILDPGNSLIRSYMGKAYYEERRPALAETQLQLAKNLDPFDPTAWLYDALRKQTTNRPVEALRDVEESIRLNDNRAVYRSRELLDEDLATRGASLGRIYRDVGFERLALLEGMKSVTTDPGDHSGHRLLADIYSAFPRHEIARVNELFQSQLLQPLNLTPIQPQLADANLFILDSAGPAEISFNEFNPLFARKRVGVQASGVVGANETVGEDVAFAGVLDRWSFGAGQFHFETDGFRANNDLDQDVANAYFQFRPAHRTTVFGEVRSTEREQGDLRLLFDPNNFAAADRKLADSDSLRLGLRHAFAPDTEIVAALSVQEESFHLSVPPILEVGIEAEGYTFEVQGIQRLDRWALTTGLRHTEHDQDEVATVSLPIPFPPFVFTSTEIAAFDTDFSSAYVYATRAVGAVTFTLGVSADFLDGRAVEEDEINPKLGVIWEPRPDTTVRASAFRTIQPPTFSRYAIQPGLQPTHVSGFNQLFFGDEGEQASRYSAAVEHEFSSALWGGVEVSKRDVDQQLLFVGPPPQVFPLAVEENARRGYVYWLPSDTLAVSATYEYDDVSNDEGAPLTALVATRVRTHKLPLTLAYFHRSGFSIGVTTTYVDQVGDFLDLAFPVFPTTADDQFWVTDVAARFRLPNRRGQLALEAKNVFDDTFNFQDIDPENPRIFPERFVSLSFTLAF